MPALQAAMKTGNLENILSGRDNYLPAPVSTYSVYPGMCLVRIPIAEPPCNFILAQAGYRMFSRETGVFS